MTAQASISFDAEYARVLKAAQTAQARGDDFEQVVNACMEALKLAGITNDAPLDQLVARLAGERDESERTTLAMVADYAKQSAQIAALQAKVVSTYAEWYAPHKIKLAALQAQLEDTQRERDEARRELATLRAAHTAQLAKDKGSNNAK